MRLLITGATGYIGCKLVERLIAAGHSVELIVRPGSQVTRTCPNIEQSSIHVYDGGQTSLIVAMEQARPDAVIHLASLFIAQHNSEDVTPLVSSNLLFPTQLLEAMSRAGVRHLLNTGTSWQHYLNAPYDPVNLYAATKQAFEALLQFYVEACDFKTITLKLFDTYGPGDTRPKLFKLLRSSVRHSAQLRMSAGEQLLDLVYIDDVLEAYVLALNHLPYVDKIECYGVASGERRTLRDVVAIYEEVIGQSVNVKWGSLPYRMREVMEPWSAYQLIPGWKSTVDLRDGITTMEFDSSIDGLLTPPSR